MIVIYALGGGWGHLTRSVALARVSSEATVILTNSPYAEHVRSSEPGLVIEGVTRDLVLSRIHEMSPRVLVVDTFPRGLGGELAETLGAIPARKVLVHRYLKDEYVLWANLQEFAAENYDLILIPGEPQSAAFAGLPQAFVTEPWTVRCVAELRPAPPIEVLICASGNAVELCWYGEVASRLAGLADFRCVAPECPPGCPPTAWTFHWPAMELIASAQVVIGGAGYNTVHECQACGVPLIAKAWPRKYDDQYLRAASAAALSVRNPEEAVEAALKLLGTKAPKSRGAGGAPVHAASLL